MADLCADGAGALQADQLDKPMVGLQIMRGGHIEPPPAESLRNKQSRIFSRRRRDAGQKIWQCGGARSWHG